MSGPMAEGTAQQIALPERQFLTRHGEPRCMAESFGVTCERPATPKHDVHDDRDHGLWIYSPGSVEEFGSAWDRPYTGYRLLVAETRAQDLARYRFWFGDR